MANQKLKLKLKLKGPEFKSIQKFGPKIHFFVKSLCSSIPRELDQDFRAIIFELNVFCEMTIGKAQAVSNFSPVGGRKFWITLYI